MEIVILPPEDWPAFKDLRLESLRTDPQAFGASYQDSLAKTDDHWRARLESVLAGQGNWLFFAKEEDRVVGMAGAFLRDDPHVANIYGVYVREPFRGKGISKRLMNHLLETLAQDPELHTATLCVNKDQAAAVALYKSVGFRVTGSDHCPLGDGLPHEEWIMELPLSS